MRDDQRLMADALTMSVNKSLDDVTTLLQWATEAGAPGEKLRHIRMALQLLEDTARNLEALEKA